MRRHLLLPAAAVLASSASLAVSARAEHSELFGESTQAVGMAGAGSALEDGAAAGTSNAAALGLVAGDDVRLHYLFGHVDLAPVRGVSWLDGRDEAMPSLSLQPHALTIEFTKVLGRWVRAGAHVTFPIPYIYFLETKDPWVPYVERWENRLGRGMGTASLSVRLPVRGIDVSVRQRARFGAEAIRAARPGPGGSRWRPVPLDDALQGGVWLGFSLSLRPKGIINVDLDLAGGEEEGGPVVVATLNDVDLASRYVWRPQLALLVDFGTFCRGLEGLRFGLSWKPESRTWISPIHLDVEVLDLEPFGPPLSLVERIQAEVWLGLIDFYDPDQVRFSLALDRPRLALAADVQVNRWSEIVASYGRVVEGDDGEDGRLLIRLPSGTTYEYSAVGGRFLDEGQFRDSVDVSVGAELRPPGRSLPGARGELALKVRMGFRWVQGFARPVSGPSGLIDSDSFAGAAGLGLQVPFPGGWVLGGPLRLDWAVQVIRLTPFELPKDAGVLAGYRVPVEYSADARWPGGWVVVSGLTLGLAF